MDLDFDNISKFSGYQKEKGKAIKLNTNAVVWSFGQDVISYVVYIDRRTKTPRKKNRTAE